MRGEGMEQREERRAMIVGGTVILGPRGGRADLAAPEGPSLPETGEQTGERSCPLCPASRSCVFAQAGPLLRSVSPSHASTTAQPRDLWQCSARVFYLFWKALGSSPTAILVIPSCHPHSPPLPPSPQHLSDDTAINCSMEGSPTRL